MAKVIAYGTERQGYYDLFMASCRRFEIDPVILGWGEAWEGTCRKLISICEFLENLPEDEVVISVDPFDVLFLRPLEDILALFHRQVSPFLCGALKLRSFNAKVYDREFNRSGLPTPATPTGYDFLNAGTWISRAGYARRLLRELFRCGAMNECLMDQEVFTSVYISDPAVMDIDWSCKIFHNVLFRDFITRRPDISDLEFRDGMIRNRACGTEPGILHASGNTRMRKIALALGYDPSLTRPVHDLKNYLSKAVFHFREIIRISWKSIMDPVLQF